MVIDVGFLFKSIFFVSIVPLESAVSGIIVYRFALLLVFVSDCPQLNMFEIMVKYCKVNHDPILQSHFLATLVIEIDTSS